MTLNSHSKRAKGAVIDRPFCLPYFGDMTDNVAFFEYVVTCAHCSEATLGVVFERSGTINCDECGGIIFDARDTGGTVVILELEESTVQ